MSYRQPLPLLLNTRWQGVGVEFKLTGKKPRNKGIGSFLKTLVLFFIQFGTASAN